MGWEHLFLSCVEDRENERESRSASRPDAALYGAADDAALVVASLLGDLAAFDALAHRYRRAVQFVARQWVASDATAEDIVQDVLVAAFQALPDLDDPAKFAGWLYAITRNRARRTADRERRMEPAGDAADRADRERREDRADTADPAARWEQ